MKTLIATNNVTKFELMRYVLRDAGISGECIRPADLQIDKDVDETGSLENRAMQKASALRDLLRGDLRGEGIDLYVGVDDGIRIEKEGKTYAESYEATDRILAGDSIEIGDDITIMRAFAFITHDGKQTTCMTRVPLYFLGNPDNIKRDEGIYPLAQVLAYHGSRVPAGALESEGDAAMTSKFSIANLQEALSGLGIVQEQS